MVKKSKKQIKDEFYVAYKRTKGEPVELCNKSIPTHPVVPVKGLPERDVQVECMRWLNTHRIFHNRHDCGNGPGHAIYGIKGAGDIIGILPSGQHFEVEFKAGKGGRLSVGQQERMWDVRSNGGEYFVVHGVEELAHYLGGLI